jgi:hypothetical protein
VSTIFLSLLATSLKVILSDRYIHLNLSGSFSIQPLTLETHRSTIFRLSHCVSGKPIWTRIPIVEMDHVSARSITQFFSLSAKHKQKLFAFVRLPFETSWIAVLVILGNLVSYATYARRNSVHIFCQLVSVFWVLTLLMEFGLFSCSSVYSGEGI